VIRRPALRREHRAELAGGIGGVALRGSGARPHDLGGLGYAELVLTAQDDGLALPRGQRRERRGDGDRVGDPGLRVTAGRGDLLGLGFGPAIFLTATLFFWFGRDWLRARNWS
jgi:hypothetical protein